MLGDVLSVNVSPENAAAGSGERPPAHRRRFVIRLALWGALFAACVSIYNQTYESISAVAIHHLQVRPAARLIAWTLPAESIRAVGVSVESPSCRVILMRGCDGVEAWLLLATAMIVFPQPMRRRAMGILWGSALVFGLNLLRIVTLFHLARIRPEWFEIAHGLIWQSLIVLAIGWFAWTWLQPPAPSRASAGGIR